MRHEPGGKARPLVDDLDDRGAGLAPAPHLDRRPGGRVAQRVLEQVLDRTTDEVGGDRHLGVDGIHHEGDVTGDGARPDATRRPG